MRSIRADGRAGPGETTEEGEPVDTTTLAEPVPCWEMERSMELISTDISSRMADEDLEIMSR